MQGFQSAVATFVEEAREIIEFLEGQFLDLEKDADILKVDAIFRALHTVKGSGAMFGFSELARFTHYFEDAYDKVRDGKVTVDPALIDLSLRARDHMNVLLDAGPDDGNRRVNNNYDEAEAIIKELSTIVGQGSGLAPTAPSPSKEFAIEGTRNQTWNIKFRPSSSALKNGMRPDLLMGELAELGEMISLSIDDNAVPELEHMDPLESYLAWNVLLSSPQEKSAIEAVFVFADDADLSIKQVVTSGQHEDGKRASSSAEQVQDRKRASKSPEASDETIRIPASRLDDIVDQLGELVIAQARLEGVSERLEDGELVALSEEMARLVSSLRETTLAIRMLPIETVFGKFKRVVRDLSVELGKEVRLETEGGDTEIDKNVIDRLTEPLVHLIRNSIDHGIESAAVREASGKAPVGTLRLSAHRESGEVSIIISDDGAGLDAMAIRERAVERGLIASDSEISEENLFDLIFAPGFSTAKEISKVSGRGVGMDAVKTVIEGLRGKVDLWSEKGKGTRIALKLPVSLAIIDGLLVRLGNDTYVVPLDSVEECVDLKTMNCDLESGRTMLQIRGEMVPWLEMREVFGSKVVPDADRRLVIVRANGSRLGLILDGVLGQHQTVIKPFSPYHRNIEGLSGSTILPDGSVALIIDVASLSKAALRASKNSRLAA